MKIKNICTISAIFLMVCAGSCNKDAGWIELFNGENLDGWVQRNGKAEYLVENNEIVGIARPNTPNSFLCTEKEYGDFILELESKAYVNSGIQIRSHHNIPENNKGGVYGYQVEIGGSLSGGIYDEGRNGWLYRADTYNPEALKAFKNNEWNHFRVEAIGHNIKTWANGIPVTDLLVDLDASGFIGLQVHGVGKEGDGATARWRNIRIMTKNPEANRKTDTPPIKQVNAIPITLIKQD